MMIDDGILRQILRAEAQDRYVGSDTRLMLESLIERLDVIVSAQPIKDPEPVFDSPEVGYVSDPMEGGYVFADPTEGGRGFAIGGFLNGPAAGLYPGKIHEVHGGPVTCWCGHPAFMPTRAVGCDLDRGITDRRSWPGKIHGTCEYEAWNHLAHSYGNGRFFCDGDVGSPPDHELMTVEDTIKRHTTGRSEQTAHSGGPVINRDTLPEDMRMMNMGEALRQALIEDKLLHSAQERASEVERITVPSDDGAELPHAWLQHSSVHGVDRHRVVVDFGVEILGAERFATWFNEGDWRPVLWRPVPAGPTAEQAAAMQGIDLTAGTMTLPLEETEPDVSGGGVPYKPVTIDDIKQDPASVYHGFEADAGEHFCKWCDASQYAEQHKHGMTGRVPLKKLQPLDEYPPPKQD